MWILVIPFPTSQILSDTCITLWLYQIICLYSHSPLNKDIQLWFSFELWGVLAYIGKMAAFNNLLVLCIFECNLKLFVLFVAPIGLCCFYLKFFPWKYTYSRLRVVNNLYVCIFNCPQSKQETNNNNKKNTPSKKTNHKDFSIPQVPLYNFN